MRRLLALLLVGVLLVAVVRAAQLRQGRTPGPVLSPHESTGATIDGAALVISYGRPSMRGRKIFGNLVPYGQIWCPGADQCTTLTTDSDLQFAGLKLAAGEYSLWMEPTEAAWTLIFNSDARAFHTRHNARLDVGTVALEKQTLPSPVERLTFSVEPNQSRGGGAIVMSWATTRVSAPFAVVR